MSETVSELKQLILKLQEEIKELKQENAALMHKIISRDILTGKALSTKDC